jgi:hypothetical protein
MPVIKNCTLRIIKRKACCTNAESSPLFNYLSFMETCHNSYSFFVHLGITLILVLGFYSGLSSRVRMVYLFSLCIVLLLSSRFAATALVWFSNFLKYLVFHFFISLSTAFICRFSWILWLLMYEGAFRMDQRVLD